MFQCTHSICCLSCVVSLITCHMAIIPKRFICPMVQVGALSFSLAFSISLSAPLSFRSLILLFYSSFYSFLSLSPSLSQHDLISQLPPFCSLMYRIIKIVCSTICHSTNLSRKSLCCLSVGISVLIVSVCVCVGLYMYTYCIAFYESVRLCGP